MNIEKIRLTGFRNISSLELSPSEGVNVIYGENAQGKTNLLEAIWMTTGFKSFRSSKDSELVGFGRNFAKVEVNYNNGQRTHEVEINITNRRNVKLNGIGLKSPAEMIGKFNAVIFSPDFMSIVKEGPGERRSFLDTSICQLTPSYSGELKEYNRALTQRNAVLKSENPDKAVLDILDVQLAVHGEKIVKLRKRYLEVLTPFISEIYSGLSSGKEELTLSYIQKHNESGKENIEDLLKKSREKDIIIGTTSVGPHRDDTQIRINGIGARDYGSQGQQRSCAIALKLAEAAVIAEKTGIKPVILLDDVMSELDESRQDYILNHIGDRQVFITCCDPHTVKHLDEGKTVHITSGYLSHED